MPTLPVNDNTPINQYTASGGQTQFAWTFWVEEAADLDVYVNGTLKTLTTDYTVPSTSLKVDAGGTLTFNVGLTNGDKVTITRSTQIDRVTGFNESGGGSFRGESLNLEFSRIIAMLQDKSRDIDRSVRLSPFSTFSTSGLVLNPTVADANKVMRVNSAGNALELVTAVDAQLGQASQSFVTLQAESTLTSERVLTAGAEIRLTDGGAGGAVTMDFLPNPNKYLSIADDFMTDSTGDHDWGSATLNVATFGRVGTAISGRPGVSEFSVSNAVSAMHRYLLGDSLLGDGAVDFEFHVAIPTLSTGSEEFEFYTGLFENGVSASAVPINGVYFQYNRAVDSNFWSICTTAASVTTKQVLANAVTAGTWFKLGASINAGGTSVTFYIDGVSVGTITTNIPTATIYNAILFKKTVGNVARTARVDLFKFRKVLTTAR